MNVLCTAAANQFFFESINVRCGLRGSTLSLVRTTAQGEGWRDEAVASPGLQKPRVGLLAWVR
jgi:hypothetical protein